MAQPSPSSTENPLLADQSLDHLLGFVAAIVVAVLLLMLISGAW